MHIPSPHHHLILVATLALVVYSGTLDNDFIRDDYAAIRDNPIVQRANLSEILTSDYWAGHHNDRSGLFRPLTTLSYALQHQLFGHTPFSYHLINILLHALTALLLYRLVLDLTHQPNPALAAALLFAVHPALSETVCSAVGRAGLQAASLSLTTLILHLRRRPFAATIALFLSLLCKESTIVTPGLVLLIDVFQYRTFSRKSYRKPYLIYVGATIAYLAWRYSILSTLGPTAIDRLDNPLVELDPDLRLLNATALLGHYLGLLVLPALLSADYSYSALPLTKQFISPLLALVVFGIGLLSIVLIYTWRRQPWVCFGLIWILLALAPVANILLPIGTIMAERLLYLPTMGFCIGLAILLEKVPRSSLVLCAFIVLLALRTALRVADWQDSYTLFSSTTQAYPQNARAWRILGQSYFERGEQAQGRAALNKALAILPDYYEVFNDLGSHYLQQKQYERALGNLESSLRIDSDYPPTWLNLGLAFYHLQRRTEAGQAFTKALQLDPHFDQACYNLGVLAIEAGEVDRAASFFSRTLELNPYHSQARHNLDKIQQQK